jgi:hypothetical protein
VLEREIYKLSAQTIVDTEHNDYLSDILFALQHELLKKDNIVEKYNKITQNEYHQNIKNIFGTNAASKTQTKNMFGTSKNQTKNILTHLNTLIEKVFNDDTTKIVKLFNNFNTIIGSLSASETHGPVLSTQIKAHEPADKVEAVQAEAVAHQPQRQDDQVHLSAHDIASGYDSDKFDIDSGYDSDKAVPESDEDFNKRIQAERNASNAESKAEREKEKERKRERKNRENERKKEQGRKKEQAGLL